MDAAVLVQEEWIILEGLSLRQQTQREPDQEGQWQLTWIRNNVASSTRAVIPPVLGAAEAVP